MTDTRLDFAIDLAREAGRLAQDLRAHPDGLTIQAKAPQDFVTAADLAVESLIRDRITQHFPQDSILGEEGGATVKGIGYWIVDPIDGTTNYLRSLPEWAVSIAYFDGTALTHGVIFAPDLSLMAQVGQSGMATMNGKQLQVSSREGLANCVVAIGRSAREENADYAARLQRLLQAGCEYRRCGAATIGLLGVAAGWLEAYHEYSLNLWDCAAAIALIRAAGGMVCHGSLERHLTQRNEVYATNGQNADLLALLISHQLAARRG
ncbi:MAG: inositol monophosphatase [Verrucomicrobia bacterium]|nr:inositol monophosphatase [Verrucomicrobiota bacterium]